MTDDKMLARIAALLRQAEGTDNAHEAEAFMATVYGAMLAARAYGDAKVFSDIVAHALKRLAPAAR